MVRNVGIAVHVASNSVTAKVEVDRVPVRVGYVANRRRDIAERVSGDSLSNARNERLLRRGNDAQVLRIGIADDERHGGIRDPPVDAGREIDADDVTLGDGVIVRQSVEDGVIDARADNFSERRSTK